MPELKPLYPYAGGKVRLIKHFYQHLTKAAYYVEPFFGGGSVFCHVLNNGLARRFIINDLNPEIVRIYLDIKDDAEAVLDEAISIWEVYAKLSMLDKKHKFNEELNLYHRSQSSGRLLFLMNTSFGAMWITSPVTGLYAPTSGHTGVQAYKDHIVPQYQVRLWHVALKTVDIRCGAYGDIDIPDNSLVFCDPPYRNARDIYYRMFSDEDQVRCFNWCSEISRRMGVKVLQTNNSDGTFFENLVKGVGNAVCEHYDVNYSNGPVWIPGKEVVMVWNP